MNKRDDFDNWLYRNPGKTTLIVAGVVFLLPILFTLPAPSWILVLADERKAHIGDAIAGITAPFIGLFSAYLVFISFRAQIAANKKIAEYRHEDGINAAVTRFADRAEALSTAFSVSFGQRLFTLSDYTTHLYYTLQRYNDIDVADTDAQRNYILLNYAKKDIDAYMQLMDFYHQLSKLISEPNRSSNEMYLQSIYISTLFNQSFGSDITLLEHEVLKANARNVVLYATEASNRLTYLPTVFREFGSYIAQTIGRKG